MKSAWLICVLFAAKAYEATNYPKTKILIKKIIPGMETDKKKLSWLKRKKEQIFTKYRERDYTVNSA